MDPEEVASVKSKEDFVGFVHELAANLRENPGEWENATLESFLGAVAAWSGDLHDGYFMNNKIPIPESPDWNLFARILLAAKYYE